jgi:hypothetical protein
LEVFVGPADGLDEERLVGLAGGDGGTGLTPLEHPFTRVEQEAALELFGLGGGAIKAFLSKDGTDLLFAELGIGGGSGLGEEAGGGSEEDGETEAYPDGSVRVSHDHLIQRESVGFVGRIKRGGWRGLNGVREMEPYNSYL